MIFAIKPFEIHDGDGIRTTLFFKGCPLRCKWCHNPESITAKRDMLYDPELCRGCMRCTSLCDANVISNDGRHIFERERCSLCEKCKEVCPGGCFEISGEEKSAEELRDELLRDEIFMKESGGGVTFSGGEPLLQSELCVDIAKQLKERGINIAIDTCGMVSKAALDSIRPYADSFLYDLKAIDEQVHIACTGVSNKQILENLEYVDSFGIPIEIRYPFVPGMNDGEAEKIARFVKKLTNVTSLKILPYHNYADRKYLRLGIPYPLPDTPVPTREDIESAAELMRSVGLEIIVTY